MRYAKERAPYTTDDICKLIGNIFVQFGGRLFRQVIGIPMGTNSAPLLAVRFLYSCDNEFLDNIIRSSHRRLVWSFNETCYMRCTICLEPA